MIILATPTQTTSEKKGGFSRYLKGVRSELKKVIWPTKKELINYSLLVLFMSAISAIVIALFDLIVHQLFVLFIG